MDLSDGPEDDDRLDPVSVAVHMPVDPGMPVLLPELRKIRHVTGIVLRNLSMDKATTINRAPANGFNASVSNKSTSGVSGATSGTTSGITNTNTAIPGITSPDSDPTYHNPLNIHGTPPTSPTSPRAGFTKRRSKRSASLQAAFPELTLLPGPEDLQISMDEKLLDTMVVMYTSGQADPIYISEVIEGATNPEFHEIDFSKLQKRVNADLAVDIYCRAKPTDYPTKVASTSFQLKDLVFLGRTMDSIDMRFDFNSLILVLTDGYYLVSKSRNQSLNQSIKQTQGHNDSKQNPNMHGTSPLSDNNNIPGLLSPNEARSGSGSNTNSWTHRHTVSSGSKTSIKHTTSVSFDVLLKIRNLEDCIADCRASIAEVTQLIGEMLNKHNYIMLTKHHLLLKNKAKLLQDGILHEKQKHTDTLAQIQNLKEKLALRRELMARNKDSNTQKNNSLVQLTKNTQDTLNDIKTLNINVAHERARLARTVQQIFPIEPVENGKPLQFSICNVLLPDIVVGVQSKSSSSEVDEDELDAAHGFVAQLTLMLAFYLEMPLRYPIQPYGSLSFVIDPISKIQGSRMFPLWMKSSLFYRFEYGIYLLHKDIEQLLNSQKLVVSDSRHTLANLKNLLLVVTAV